VHSEVGEAENDVFVRVNVHVQLGSLSNTYTHTHTHSRTHTHAHCKTCCNAHTLQHTPQNHATWTCNTHTHTHTHTHTLSLSLSHTHTHTHTHTLSLSHTHTYTHTHIHTYTHTHIHTHTLTHAHTHTRTYTHTHTHTHTRSLSLTRIHSHAHVINLSHWRIPLGIPIRSTHSCLLSFDPSPFHPHCFLFLGFTREQIGQVLLPLREHILDRHTYVGSGQYFEDPEGRSTHTRLIACALGKRFDEPYEVFELADLGEDIGKRRGNMIRIVSWNK
jgi:hypothetical protein